MKTLKQRKCGRTQSGAYNNKPFYIGVNKEYP